MKEFSAVLLFCTCLWLARSYFRRWKPVALAFWLSILFFYAFGSLTLSLGLRPPLVSPLAGYSDHHRLETNVALLAYSVLVAASYTVLAPAKVRSLPLYGRFARSDEATLRRAYKFYVAAAIVATGLLVSQAGSNLDELQVSSKVEKSLAGLSFLQFPVLVAAVIGAGFAAEFWRKSRAMSFLYGGTAVALTFAVFLWGSRRAIPLIGLVLLLHLLSANRASTHAPNKQRIGPKGIALAALLVLLVTAGVTYLRDYRQQAIQRGFTSTIAEQGVIEGTARSLNLAIFDSLDLAIRDFPTEYPFVGAEYFSAGVSGVVPRLLWQEKPPITASGAAFRQIYEPSVRNGWPLGAAGEWYISFGYVGLFVGALLTGLVLRWVESVASSCTRVAQISLSAVFGYQVLELGLSSQSVTRYVGFGLAFALPLLFLAVFGTASQDRSARLRPELTDVPIRGIAKKAWPSGAVKP